MQKSKKANPVKKWVMADFHHQMIHQNQQRLLKGGNEIITEDDVNN